MKRKWPGKERRNPSWDNPCKYTLDRIREEVISFGKNLNPNSVILDFGCGEKPYYPLLREKSKRYVGVDISDSPERNPNMNIIIKPGEKIPYPSNYFDAIICTQVFEHIENINFYSKELTRVLKPSGQALISSAFSWDYHPYPHDYWRITEDGYRHIFKNFTEIKFKYDTNSLQTIIQSLNLLLARKGVKFRSLFFFINFILSRINFEKGDGKFPANIFVYLKK